MLAAIPTAEATTALAVLFPGMNTGVQDVGGAAGVQVTGAGSIHGGESGPSVELTDLRSVTTARA